MKRRDRFFISLSLLFGFVVWFFPKSIDSQRFLGFSNPLLLYKEELKKQVRQGHSLEKRTPSAVINQK